MHNFGEVNKQLQSANQSEERLIEKMEKLEEKANPEGEELDIYAANKESTEKGRNSKWVKKFITITKYNEKLQKDAETAEKSVGPNNFKAIMKLGQGSFGIVYLVEKLKVEGAGAEMK
jgi:uncharacterized protein (UPF0335 family)